MKKYKVKKRKVSTEFDGDQTINKLDALLHRHKNQAEDTSDTNKPVDSSQTVSSISETVSPKVELAFADEIPTLTEIVLLQSDSIQTQTQTQTGRTLSLQQILDSALDEVSIEMKTSDRIMLTKALEKQLIKI